MSFVSVPPQGGAVKCGTVGTPIKRPTEILVTQQESPTSIPGGGYPVYKLSSLVLCEPSRVTEWGH